MVSVDAEGVRPIAAAVTEGKLISGRVDSFSFSLLSFLLFLRKKASWAIVLTECGDADREGTTDED
jgi:hypothetical protein